jgi:hypothetical protein
MIRQIAPLFFTMDIPGTLAHYKAKFGFKCLGTWQDPPVYASLRATIRRFTSAVPNLPQPTPTNMGLDAYVFIEDADALYAEYAARDVEFTRGLANMPWHSREFVAKDCDGRLLAFGANL